MKTWRDVLYEAFETQARLLLVHDVDYLLADAKITQHLKDLGYEILPYEDSISFRYLYERHYRQNDQKLVVISNQDSEFPYDFLQQGVKLEVNYKKIFPRFSMPLLRELGITDLDRLNGCHSHYPGPDSREATLIYLMNAFYQIPYETIKTAADVYRALIDFYRNHQVMAHPIGEFLRQRFRDIPVLNKLPLSELLLTQTHFYNHLQREWNQLADVGEREFIQEPALHQSHLFATPSLWVLLSDLFARRKLQRLTVPALVAYPEWMEPGLKELHQVTDANQDIEQLKLLYTEQLEQVNSYRDWGSLIQMASELKHLSKGKEDVFPALNEAFLPWMQSNYNLLMNISYLPKPKMIHQIPDYLSHQHKKRTALLVMDGMSYLQWQQIKGHLKISGLKWEEDSVFAWVPTLTSVSRQALFAGKIPMKFGDSIQTTQKEERLWKDFWQENKMAVQYVAYQKALGEEAYNRAIIKGFKNAVKVYGAVIDVIDQFVHGSMDEEYLTANLEVWLKRGYLVNLLRDLLAAGYDIYLTADHGNTEATGTGRSTEGVTVRQKSERVMIYESETLLENSKVREAGLAWPTNGLPPNYYPLIAQTGESFTDKGKKTVVHGGVSIEEVIVPFVKIWKG